MSCEHAGASGRNEIATRVVIACLLLVGGVLTWLRFTQGIGGVANLDDKNPWGFWMAFDLLCGIALSAGGFAVAVSYYVFGVRRLGVHIRAALATAFLGYFFEVIALLFEVGQPWRLIYIFLAQGTSSVLFLVGLCVCLYLTVTFLELLPALFERLGRHEARAKAAHAAVFLAAAGAVIATAHQSSLGALYLIAPSKMHPLWRSDWLPLFFLLSAIFAGFSMVVAEGRLSNACLETYMDDGHRRSAEGAAFACAKLAPAFMLLYLLAKCADLGVSGAFRHLWSGWGAWFLLELGGGVALPSLLYVAGAKRKNARLIVAAAVLSVAGAVVNRFNVSLVAFNYNLPPTERYFPSLTEVAISAVLVALLIAAYRFMCANLPILRSREEHGEE